MINQTLKIVDRRVPVAVSSDPRRFIYPAKTAPICLNDASWTAHYGNRRGDVNVERL